MKFIIAIAVSLLLTACGSLGLSAEQIKAAEGSSSSICVESPGWNGAAVKVHYVSFGGKATGTAGGGGEASCGSSIAKFNNEGKATTLPVGTTVVPGPTPGTFVVVPK